MEKLIEQLKVESSQKNTEYIISYVNYDPFKFHDLIKIMLSDDKIISHRAAWVVEKIWIKEPELMEPYIVELIDFLPKIYSDGLKRHILKILSESVIPENKSGELLDYCFDCIQNAQDLVAAKVYSMQVIYNYCLKEPDLKYELISIIENEMDKNSAAFRSRGSKIIKSLRKL